METTTPEKNDNMEAYLEERAQQLFLLSDQERKGFIVKRDMQRMRSEIPLTPEQLEAVFDSLDVNNNGYLTIEQFLSGFGEFIASKSNNSWEEIDLMETSQKDMEQNDEPLQYLIQELESINVFQSVEVLKQLCWRVERESNPNIQRNLESFLHQLVTDLKRCQEGQRNLEEALKSKEEEHESQVRRLFEEMETQINEEKRNQARQEEHVLRLRRSTLEQDLLQKDLQLQDAVVRQQELVDRVQALKSKEAHVREENQRLLRAKEELEVQLETEHREVLQLQRFLEDLRQNEAWDRRKHLSAGFRLAKKIMLEQQGLMHQLQLLQQMKSTLEGGGEGDKDSTSNHIISRGCQCTNREDMKSDEVQRPSMKSWKKHHYRLDSEDDFFEGTELITCQKYDESGAKYVQNDTSVR